jgi:hypothetical protein
MASIKGLLSLFFNGAPPPAPVFVKYKALQPTAAWMAGPPDVAWMVSPPRSSRGC